MKPLMGQVQNQAHLEDLLGSPKAKAGNFGRPASSSVSSTGKASNEPSFNDMLLATIHKTQDSKQANLKAANTKTPTPKLPDEPRTVARPKPNPVVAPPEAKPSSRPEQFKEPPRIHEQTSAIRDSVAREAAPAENSMSSAASGISSESKAALAPLKKQLSGKSSSEALLNGNAVLAFVAGRLDKLEPEALPSIVSDSMLIKQAISSGDVAEFMQTPMTIADLANMLELDQGLLNKAAMNGLDPTKAVTPKDFINALGLDSGRVTAELTMLQQKLPVEGIKPYIDRAKAMAAKQPLAQSEGEGLAPQRPTGDSPENTLGMTTSMGVPDSVTSPIEIQVPPGMNAPLGNQAVAGMTSPQAMNVNASGQSAISAPRAPSAQISKNVTAPLADPRNLTSKPTIQSPLEMPLSGIATESPVKTQTATDPVEQLLAMAAAAGRSIIKTDFANIEQATPMPDLSAARPATISQIPDHTVRQLTTELSDLSNAPTSAGVEFDTRSEGLVINDPYSQMGQMMDSSTALNISFGGDGNSQRTLQEHLLAKGLSQSSFAQAVSGDGKSIEIKPENILESTQSVDVSARDSGPLSQDMSQINLKFDLNAQPTSNMTSFGDSSQGESGSFEREGRESMGDQLTNGTDQIGGSLGQAATTSRESIDSFSDKLANNTKANPRDHFASKILNHAQMMFKNGGGSMRVDVEAPGIGKVDVAINLINNQLDVRIITASEQARDMISKEVSGLRDGLTQQGINLRGIEVGKAGESSARDFSGQGQQHFGNGANNQRATYDDMKEYVQSFKNSYVPRANVTIAPPSLSATRWSGPGISAASGGRLEVRA